MGDLAQFNRRSKKWISCLLLLMFSQSVLAASFSTLACQKLQSFSLQYESSALAEPLAQTKPSAQIKSLAQIEPSAKSSDMTHCQMMKSSQEPLLNVSAGDGCEDVCQCCPNALTAVLTGVDSSTPSSLFHIKYIPFTTLSWSYISSDLYRPPIYS